MNGPTTTMDSALLSGYRVALLSMHHDTDVEMALQQYGAAVSAAATAEPADLTDDEQLRHLTETVVGAPPDIVITTTALGVRSWIAAADHWRLRNSLVVALSQARILACAPKAADALHAVGLTGHRLPTSASLPELLHHLIGRGRESDAADLRGNRIVVQLSDSMADGDPIAGLPDVLAAMGAEVVPVRVSRWCEVAPGGGLDRLIAAIAARRFDAVGFSSATAATATLKRADDLDVSCRLLSILRSEARVICADPSAAAPLVRHGVPAAMSRRVRHDDFAHHIVDELQRTDGCAVHAAGHRIELHGNHVLVDGLIRSVSLSGVALLRLLAKRPGNVVARDDLLHALPGNANTPHAVEAAMARLRGALGDKRIVATVVKRGYRLAVDG